MKTEYLLQTTLSDLLMCVFVFFVYLKHRSLVVLWGSFCIQHPRCLIVIVAKTFPRLPQVLHAHVGIQVKPIAPTALAQVWRLSPSPRNSLSLANGTSAAVSGPRTASAALIGPHGCGLQKRSAELSEQPPPPAAFLYIISVMLPFPPSHEIWEDSNRRGRRGS